LREIFGKEIQGSSFLPRRQAGISKKF